jgi:adenosylcobinamide-phosphate synthase
LARALFALSLILGCWSVTALATTTARNHHPLLGFGLEVLLIFFALSARSLRDAGMTIHRLLVNDDVDRARREIALIVGRDVDHYGADDIARAAVETVAENFVDGVLSPLAMAYKMVNTLDSMVGYKNERYRRFGWAAARIGDAANFVPARLSVIVISLAAWLLNAQAGGRALTTAIREGAHHSSPNAGFPEAAFAGALAVKLNCPNLYGGVLVDKPHIGAAFGPVRRDHVRSACQLMVLASLMSLLICGTLSVIWR